MMRCKVILSLVCLILLFGCSRPGKTTEADAADAGPPVQGDWAIVRFESEPDNLNPLISQQAPALYTVIGVNNSQIYELLMGYDPKDWSLTKPLLAEAPPDISGDHLTYTLKIRDG